MTSAIEVRERVAAELAAIKDDVAREGLRSLLVEPERHVREWDYGPPGKLFDCWYVAKDPTTAMALVYSEHGFGPREPWGIVSTSDRAFGVDAGWFLRLEDAFVYSFGDDFPIWDLVKCEADGAERVLAASLTSHQAFELQEKLNAGEDVRSHQVLYRSRLADGIP